MKVLARSFVLVLAVLCPQLSAQTTWYVDVNGTPPGSGTPADPYTSIQYAIAQPSTLAGDTILALPGTYVENLEVAKALHFQSLGGPDVTTLDGGGLGSVVRFCNGPPNCLSLGPSSIEGFTITNGFALRGAGVFCGRVNPISILNCVIVGNSTPNSSGNGAGIVIDHCGGSLIADCVISNNFAEGSGGAIRIVGQGVHDLRQSLIGRNTAFNGGGVQISAVGSISVTFTNCTITDNVAVSDGGGIHLHQSTGNVQVTNSILWNNSPNQLSGSNIQVQYTDLQGGWPNAGPGTIDADPLFWGPQAGDYYLTASSPCIDAGDPTSPPDPDGTVTDLGHVPFDPWHCGPPCVPVGRSYCTATANSTGGPASLTADGSASLNADLLRLRTVDVPENQFGYFLMSRTQDFVPLFGGSAGNLCLGSPIIRFSAHILFSGTLGEMNLWLDFEGLPQQTVFLPGETWNFQCWFRDLVGANFTSNTSDGLSITWQ